MKRVRLMLSLLFAGLVLGGCGQSGSVDMSADLSGDAQAQAIVDLAETMIMQADENEAPWDVDQLAMLPTRDDGEAVNF